MYDCLVLIEAETTISALIEIETETKQAYGPSGSRLLY